MPYSVAAVRGKNFGGAAAWSPTDISGLQVWYDFSDISTLYQDSGKTTPVTSDGDVIGCVADKSGNGNDATQSTTANKPTYKTGIQNGLSIGRGDGSDDYMLLDSTMTLSTFTIAGAWIFNATGDSVWGDNDDCILQGTNATTISSRMSGGSWLTQSTTKNPTGSFYVWNVTWAGSGGNHVIYQNGSQEDSDAYTCANFDVTMIFSRRTALSNLNGDIGELFFYNSVVSEGDLSNIHTYLNNKWAVY